MCTLALTSQGDLLSSACTKAIQSVLSTNRGVILIAVTQQLSYKAAYDAYPCVSTATDPLLKWAGIKDSQMVTCVAHLAVLVRRSQIALVKELQVRQHPADVCTCNAMTSSSPNLHTLHLPQADC